MMIAAGKWYWRWFFVSAATTVMVSCGGGATSPDSNSGTRTGVAVDFYLSGSTVSFSNLQCPATFTNGFGEFQIPRTDCGTIRVSGGVDAATNLPLRGNLSAPPRSTVVSPITTLVQSLIETGRGEPTAEVLVKNALGLVQDPGTTDPFNDPDALAHGLAVMQIAHQIAAAFTGVAGITTVSFEDIHALAMRNIALALPQDRLAVFDSSFITTVARGVATQIAPANALADKIAIAIGPATAEAARLAALQVTTVRLHFIGIRGDRVRALDLVTRRSTIDENIRTITAAALTLAGELNRYDLRIADPFTMAAEINANINLAARVGTPVVSSEGGF